MSFNVQHADLQADPHDAIAAQLRDLAPRIPDETATLSIAPAADLELPREPTFEAAPPNDNVGDILNPPRRRARWGMFLTTACAGVVVATAWHAYGDAAKRQFSHLIPQLRPTALVPAQTAPEQQDSTSQASTPQPAPGTAAQDAAAAPADVAPAQPTAAAPAQPPLPPEVTQSLESMKQEIASLKQTVEQLQTGQQQLGRDVVKLNEQDARRKTSTQTVKPAPRPSAQRPPAPPVTSYRAPAPYPPQASSQGQTYSHATAQRETYIAPAAPVQLPPQPGDISAPRPPMPLR